MSLMSLALHRTLTRRAADNYKMNRQERIPFSAAQGFRKLLQRSPVGNRRPGTAHLFLRPAAEPDRHDPRSCSARRSSRPPAHLAGIEGWEDFGQLSGNRQIIDALRLEVKRGVENRLVDGHRAASLGPFAGISRLSRRDPRHLAGTAGAARSDQGQGRGRTGLFRQIAVPGHHQPRIEDAAQCDRRLFGNAGRPA